MLPAILDGILAFAKDFAGQLVSETMLVRGLNDNDGGMKEVADFLRSIEPDKAYLSIPTRPPAETGVACRMKSLSTGRIRSFADIETGGIPDRL